MTTYDQQGRQILQTYDHHITGVVITCRCRKVFGSVDEFEEHVKQSRESVGDGQ